jgi:adenylyltransferase/sulfurtransferase
MRYDRQIRIPGWDQSVLGSKKVAMIGNTSIVDDLLFSSAQLGIDNIAAYRFELNENFLGMHKPRMPTQRGLMDRFRKTSDDVYQLGELVKEANPNEDYLFVDSAFVNCDQFLDFLDGYDTVVDMSNYSLSKQVTLNWLNSRDKKGIIVNPETDKVKFYTYMKGRDNEHLKQVISTNPFPTPQKIDFMIESVGAGLVLEELKNILMNKDISDCVVGYSINRIGSEKENYSGKSGLFVGNGALGCYLILGVASLWRYCTGLGRADMMDPDTVDETNLNRQPLYLVNSVGQNKSLISSSKMQELTDGRTKSSAIVKEFTDKTSVREYDFVVDGVDNIEARLAIIEACKRDNVPLISGGTSYDGGQVVTYISGKSKSPDEILDWQKMLEVRRRERQQNPSCVYQPNPSVIMSGKIIGTIMAHEIRKLFYPENYGPPITNGMIVYEANSPRRLATVRME